MSQGIALQNKARREQFPAGFFLCDLACDRDVVVEEKTGELWFYSPCDVVQTVCMNRILHEKTDLLSHGNRSALACLSSAQELFLSLVVLGWIGWGCIITGLRSIAGRRGVCRFHGTNCLIRLRCSF